MKNDNSPTFQLWGTSFPPQKREKKKEKGARKCRPANGNYIKNTVFSKRSKKTEKKQEKRKKAKGGKNKKGERGKSNQKKKKKKRRKKEQEKKNKGEEKTTIY